MKHHTHTELILYLNKKGLAADQRQNIDSHLKKCVTCRTQVNEIQERLNMITQDNRNTCQHLQQYLSAYIEGELDSAMTLKLEDHLAECARCQSLHQSLTNLPAWENIPPAEIKISVATQKRIETTILKALANDRVKLRPEEIKPSLRRKVKHLITEVILTLRPYQPAAVFRGEKLDLSHVIEHPGGDLQLETGLKNITVELTSIFEDFTLRGLTDDQGEVIFKDLAKGDYIANVAGYQLTKIKVKKAK